MLNIHIFTIPHRQQSYPTVGNWQIGKEGNVHIPVSEMGNSAYEFLVGIHEQIESFLCLRDGITAEAVTTFDLLFEQERAEGKHSVDDEPGDDPRAPYRDEHFFATTIERLLANKLKISWIDYEKALLAL